MRPRRRFRPVHPCLSVNPELCGGLAVLIVLAPFRGGGIAPLTLKRSPFGVPHDRTQAKPSSPCCVSYILTALERTTPSAPPSTQRALLVFSPIQGGISRFPAPENRSKLISVRLRTNLRSLSEDIPVFPYPRMARDFCHQ